MLKEKLKNYKIILASGSPRRQQFFKDLDLNFVISIREIDEIYPENLVKQEITNYLAELKSKAFDGEIGSNEIVITSDTLVWLNGKILSKPIDYQDAFNILKLISNQTHHVFTSVCFATNKSKTTIFDETKVISKNYQIMKFIII
jgi:septum formation protein